MALRAELSRGGGYPCPRPGARPYELCVTQGKGVADPFVNDSSTGRGFVLGRAATKLRSIENYPLTGGSIGQRPVPSFMYLRGRSKNLFRFELKSLGCRRPFSGGKTARGENHRFVLCFRERRKRIGGENLTIRERGEINLLDHVRRSRTEPWVPVRCDRG